MAIHAPTFTRVAAAGVGTAFFASSCLHWRRCMSAGRFYHGSCIDSICSWKQQVRVCRILAYVVKPLGQIRITQVFANQYGTSMDGQMEDGRSMLGWVHVSINPKQHAVPSPECAGRSRSTLQSLHSSMFVIRRGVCSTHYVQYFNVNDKIRDVPIET